MTKEKTLDWSGASKHQSTSEAESARLHVVSFPDGWWRSPAWLRRIWLLRPRAWERRLPWILWLRCGVYVYVCVYVCMCMCACVHECVCVCVYVCMCVCVYVLWMCRCVCVFWLIDAALAAPLALNIHRMLELPFLSAYIYVLGYIYVHILYKNSPRTHLHVHLTHADMTIIVSWRLRSCLTPGWPYKYIHMHLCTYKWRSELDASMLANTQFHIYIYIYIYIHIHI